jgi:hypothetical protein
MTSIDSIRTKPWTEWSEEEKAVFQAYVMELKPEPISAATYTTLCNILEAVYGCGTEGNWNRIDLETLPPLVSDQSRHTANLVLRVLGLM